MSRMQTSGLFLSASATVSSPSPASSTGVWDGKSRSRISRRYARWATLSSAIRMDMFLVTGDDSPKFSVFVQVRCAAHTKAGENSVALISKFTLRVVIALTFGHQLQTTAAFIGNLLPSVTVVRAEKGDNENCQWTGDMVIVCLGVLFSEDRIVAVPFVIKIALNHRVWP